MILTALWRAGFNGQSWRRAFGVIAATGWGVALAALQLGLSWQFADSVGQTGRGARELLFYSFSPIALVRAGASTADSRATTRARRPLLVRPANLGLRGRSLCGNTSACLCRNRCVRPPGRPVRRVVADSGAGQLRTRDHAPLVARGISPTRRFARNRLFPSGRRYIHCSRAWAWPFWLARDSIARFAH